MSVWNSSMSYWHHRHLLQRTTNPSPVEWKLNQRFGTGIRLASQDLGYTTELPSISGTIGCSQPCLDEVCYYANVEVS